MIDDLEEILLKGFNFNLTGLRAFEKFYSLTDGLFLFRLV